MIMKIKKAQLNQILLIAILAFIITFSMVGITLTANDVIGANITNASVITRVYVWNTEPSLYKVTISPTTIDLTPGNTTIVNCTAYFWDYNGWRDAINQSINATFYDKATSSPDDSDDKNMHYTNSSCGLCSEVSGSDGQNGTCTCFFSVEYFANATTWECNVTIRGGPGNATERQYLNFTDSLNATAIINQLLAIDVPPEIDFGNLSVTETSSDVTENITNWGNIALNVTVRGWGGDDEATGTNLSMICDYGNISIDYEKYATVAGLTYTQMTNLTNTDTMIGNLTIYQRLDENGPEMGRDVNVTYWKIQIPLSVGGYCNGTVLFSAVAADANMSG